MKCFSVAWCGHKDKWLGRGNQTCYLRLGQTRLGTQIGKGKKYVPNCTMLGFFTAKGQKKCSFLTCGKNRFLIPPNHQEHLANASQTS